MKTKKTPSNILTDETQKKIKSTIQNVYTKSNFNEMANKYILENQIQKAILQSLDDPEIQKNLKNLSVISNDDIAKHIVNGIYSKYSNSSY